MKRLVLRIADALLAPVTILAAALLRWIRRRGIARMPLSRRIFRALGVFPVVDHYYEPFYNPRPADRRPRGDRALPGIDFNVAAQLDLLSQLRFGDELRRFPLYPTPGARFYYQNSFFGPGDAEYFYSIIRLFRPARIVEIGCGNSTLIAHEALARNAAEDPDYRCRHICIEPYENPWLATLDVELIREPVQAFPASWFAELGENDILFIDSSHVIRPGGDVLVEFLEVLPTLRPGVLVHVHDIFTPRDYPDAWLLDEVRFWNEQYLLEAFLSVNDRFEIIGALNWLKRHHSDAVAAACPVLGHEAPNAEPGSFWLRRTRQ